MPDALFSTLGISPTTDQKAIRRAYAALLKRTDQAGDPEGFAALREAYERARAWAEWQREQDDDAPEPGHSPMETETAAAPPSLDPASAQDESRPTDTPLAGEAAPAWTVSEPAPGPTPEQQAEGVIHWTRTLMQAAADQHTTLLGKAMLDERLSRLDAVEQLSASLAQSIRDQPDRQLALFEAATRHFGWNEVGQPFPDDWNLSLVPAHSGSDGIPGPPAAGTASRYASCAARRGGGASPCSGKPSSTATAWRRCAVKPRPRRARHRRRGRDG